MEPRTKIKDIEALKKFLQSNLKKKDYFDYFVNGVNFGGQ